MNTIFESRFRCDVDPEFLRKIWKYTRATETEVSGIGKLIWYPAEKVVSVLDYLDIPKQRASPGGVHLDSDALVEITANRIARGEEPGIPVWWHTHVRMSVFFSSTDCKTIEYLSEMNDPFIAVVTNHQGESRWEAHVGNMRFTWTHKLGGEEVKSSGDELEKARNFLKTVITEDTYPLISWDSWERRKTRKRGGSGGLFRGFKDFK